MAELQLAVILATPAKEIVIGARGCRQISSRRGKYSKLTNDYKNLSRHSNAISNTPKEISVGRQHTEKIELDVRVTF